MANRYFVMGQVFIANGTTTVDKLGRFTTDQTITIGGGAGNFTIFMTQGMAGTVTSGTAAITGSVVTLAAGINTLTADGNGTCTLDVTIGSAANWNHVNSWSATSGGTAGASVPTSADNAYFDANSFTAGSQTVTIDANSTCLTMDWTGATNTPTLTWGAFTLSVYGNVTFIAAMATTAHVSAYFRFYDNSTLITNGLTIACEAIGVVVAGKTLTLGDNFTSALHLYTTNGIITTGNNTVVLGGEFRSDYVGDITLNLGSSDITCAGWDTRSTTTLNAGTSTIKITGTGQFSGGDLTYNNVELNGTAHTISGSNTFAKLRFGGAAQTITHTDGTTQTFTNMTRSAGTDVKTMVGTSTGGWAYAKQGGGRIDLDYLALSYSTATVGKFFAGANSTDTTGNTGWLFRARDKILIS